MVESPSTDLWELAEVNRESDRGSKEGGMHTEFWPFEDSGSIVTGGRGQKTPQPVYPEGSLEVSGGALPQRSCGLELAIPHGAWTQLKELNQ